MCTGRRDFLGLAVGGLAGATLRPIIGRPSRTAPALDGYPRQDPGMVEEMLKVSHGNLVRVKQLVEAHPSLVKAAIDWGFGDWEDALGASSHVGRPDIAELLLAKGARPTIFSAAMMGQLEVVRAFVAARPGVQRTLGPHSLTVLHHARVGGERAKAVYSFLNDLGDADGGPVLAPLDARAAAGCIGSYAYGPGPDDRFDITATPSGTLTIFRPGLPFPRDLKHVGDLAFFPIGAETIRIRFAATGGQATALAVFDPDLLLTATRRI